MLHICQNRAAFLIPWVLVVQAYGQAPRLPDTLPLRADGDLSAQMVAGIDRYLTRATKVLVTENKRAQPIQLSGGSLRSVASQLEHVQREIQREIEQEDEDYRAISEGSNVSVQELREKAPNEWFITASEAKAMGLIAEVV